MISAVILTKNEEKNIIDCLESVNWVDEIIIVDDFSLDRTIDVIQSLNLSRIRIFKKALNGDFASQRNFALSKVKYEWVLFVDADEIIPKELRDEINAIIINGKNKIKYNGFYIRRRDYLWGKALKHGENGNIKLLRFGKKDAGKWEGNVHEEWKVSGDISELENYIIHRPHQTISDFLQEINFYTTIRARVLFDQKITTSAYEIIFYPAGKFILNFIMKLGFLDGIEGLIFAIIMSFHSFLVRAKLWLLWKKQQ